MGFLPITLKELEETGVSQPDFVLVSGDAYVDHPSFGVAIISRILESRGFSVGIIAQPNWNELESFNVFGKPRLGFLVTSGNIDSMVNHYSVAKKRRHKDEYSPNGKADCRPDRATIVYSNKIRELYQDATIILGGIEASLRRLSHYDYWDNRVRRSILLDSAADLLVYGMGEHQIIEVAEALDSGIPIEEITFINGTVYKTKDIERVHDYVMLPEYKKVTDNRMNYVISFKEQYKNIDHFTSKTLVESYGTVYVVQNIPSAYLTTNEFDGAYSLNYMRTYHPSYEEQGGIPAIKEVKFSIISNRGCYGNCNFCALAFHQGRVVQARSHKSIVSEGEKISWDPDFKGYIHDVGGPTANFRGPACDKQVTKGACADKQCLWPEPCKQLKIDHTDYLKLLRKLRAIPNVKKVFVRSGIRYDYLIHDKNTEFFDELCKHHISGQLKVAPEHVSNRVLAKMGKPGHEIYDKFVEKYNSVNEKLGMNQFIVPYLMSSHPGSQLTDAIELAEYLRDLGHMPEQVQDFYPTPGTLSTCMYYTGIDPNTMEKVYVPKTQKEKAMQRALIQYRLPQNYDLVQEALIKAGRKDLIGFDAHCLIRPRKVNNVSNGNNKTKDGKFIQKKPKETTKPFKKKTIRTIHKKKTK